MKVSATMSFLKGRMTTIGVVSAILALIAVQAVAFQQTGKKNDAFQPAAAADTSQSAASQDIASETPVAADETTAAAETTPAAKPAITGASVGDDDGNEGEDLESEEDDD